MDKDDASDDEKLGRWDKKISRNCVRLLLSCG